MGSKNTGSLYTFEMYSYPQSLSLYEGIFRCSYPLRYDVYKFCSVGCKYCFAELGKKAMGVKRDGIGSMKDVYNLNKFLYDVLVNGNIFGKSEELVRIFVSERIPILFGTLSDIFGVYEKKMRLTYETLKSLCIWKYPVNISSKCQIFEDKDEMKMYIRDIFDKYDRDKILMRVSLVGIDEDKIRGVEKVSVKARLDFLKEICKLGINCIVRVQPFLVGISDVRYKEFLYRLKEIGVKGVSWEGFKLKASFGRYCKSFLNRMKKWLKLTKGYYHYGDDLIEEWYGKYREECDKLGMDCSIVDTDYMHKNVGYYDCCGNVGVGTFRKVWECNGFNWLLKKFKDVMKKKVMEVITFRDVEKYMPEWIKDKKFDINSYHHILYCKNILLSKKGGKAYYGFKDFARLVYNGIDYNSFAFCKMVKVIKKDGELVRDSNGDLVYVVDWRDDGRKEVSWEEIPKHLRDVLDFLKRR